MLRVAVALVVAANLLFFAWARGWLSPVIEPPHHGEREPQRIERRADAGWGREGFSGCGWESIHEGTS